MLHLSTGPVFPQRTTSIIMRTLHSLRSAAPPVTVAGGSLRAQDGLPLPSGPPPPLGPSGWVPQLPPRAEQEQLPGALANGGPLSMMQREVLPSLAVVGAWDLLGPGISLKSRQADGCSLEMEIVTYMLQEARRGVAAAFPTRAGPAPFKDL